MRQIIRVAAFTEVVPEDSSVGIVRRGRVREYPFVDAVRAQFSFPGGLVQNEIKCAEVFILKQYIVEIPGREQDEKAGVQSV